MAIPSKEQMTGNNTSEAQFKSGMNNIVDYLGDVDAQSLTFGTTAELKLAKPKIGQKAKTLDSGKVWEWGGSGWFDTGEGELERANELTNQEIFTRSKLIGQSIQDGYTDKYGFFVKFFELKNKVLELYQSVSTQSILTKNIYLDESDFTVTDKYGFTYSIVQKKNSDESSTDISDILFINKIVHWSDVSFSINIPHALIDRQIQIEKKPVVLSFSGIDTEFSGTSDDVLTLPKTSDLGSGVDLYFRNKNNFTDRSKLSVSATSVPDSSKNEEIKILMIGDSNTYRGATAIVKHMLERRGYKPSFVGTFLGAGEKYRGESLPVQVAEARGGIGVLGFTYMSTARWHPVDNSGAGVDAKTISVADYLALSNTARDSYNPMLRKATASDNQDFVNNGYIFDVADYLTKFDFETPDVVFISVGGNELTQASPEDRRRLFAAGLETMISQVASGIPTAKILLGHNAAAYTTERNGEYWIEKAIPHFEIKRDLAIKYGATLLNTHALAIGDAGYQLKVASRNKYGLELGTFDDAIHYQKATRLQTYDYVAANIAAAKLNLI